MSSPFAPGFTIGHWSDLQAATGCTVVLPPAEGAVASADVRGGGTGSREIELLGPLGNPQRIQAVLLTGGSAFGLAAADGVVDWLAEQGRGHPTPAARVPLVPAAVLYDLASGDPNAHPGPTEGRLACEAADEAPQRGSVGAGTGAAVGKIRGRECSVKAGVGLARRRLRDVTVSVLAVVNAFGDVLDTDGTLLAGPRADGGFERTSEVMLADDFEPPRFNDRQNTTLVCAMTDSTLSKTECAVVAKMASAGVPRAIDPVHSAVDGDITFALASATGERIDPLLLGVCAANLTTEAIRDGVRSATEVAGIAALGN